MREVPSATGTVTADSMGLTLPHEHAFINMSATEPRDGFMTVWDERVDDVARFAAIGGSTIWDMTNGELSSYAAPVGFESDHERQLQNPLTGSRSIANVLATKALSEETGVAIILGTGHYFETYLDGAWFDRTSTNQIADYLIADLLDEIPGTGVRAGFLGEIASDLPVITAREERSFRRGGAPPPRQGFS